MLGRGRSERKSEKGNGGKEETRKGRAKEEEVERGREEWECVGE